MSNHPEPERRAGGKDAREELGGRNAPWQNPLAQSPDAEWTPDEADQMDWHVAGADSPDDVEELPPEDPRKWGRP